MCSEQHIDSLDPDLEFDSAEFEWITEVYLSAILFFQLDYSYNQEPLLCTTFTAGLLRVATQQMSVIYLAYSSSVSLDVKGRHWQRG